jgi:uncharacterized Zn finger protein
MGKHVAAALYGVGARLDKQPELLFQLRGADPTELVAKAAKGTALGTKGSVTTKALGDDLASMFGIDFDEGPVRSAKGSPAKAAPAKAAPAKAASAKAGRERRPSGDGHVARAIEAL